MFQILCQIKISIECFFDALKTDRRYWERNDVRWW